MLLDAVIMLGLMLSVEWRASHARTDARSPERSNVGCSSALSVFGMIPCVRKGLGSRRSGIGIIQSCLIRRSALQCSMCLSRYLCRWHTYNQPVELVTTWDPTESVWWAKARRREPTWMFEPRLVSRSSPELSSLLCWYRRLSIRLMMNHWRDFQAYYGYLRSSW